MFVDGHLHGTGAVERRDAGGDAGAGVDVGRERRGRGVEIVAGQRVEVQPVADAGDMARQTRPQALAS